MRMPHGAGNSGFSIVKNPLHNTGFSRSIVNSPAHASYKFSLYLALACIPFWLSTSLTFSQTRDVAFGRVKVVNIPESVNNVRILGTGQAEPKRLFLWPSNSTRLLSVDLPLLEHPNFRVYNALKPFDDVLIADFTGDGKDDLLLVHRALQQIDIITDTEKDTLRALRTLQLSVEPSKVIVGDVNNDKRLDVLIVDARNPGIVPYLGQGNGSFRSTAIISPDNAVQDVSLVPLNNDFLTDMIFYDWVKSELHLSYGVGRGRFLDLTAHGVEGKAQALVVLPLTSNRFMDIVLQMPNEIQVWEGDETGDFRKLFSRQVEREIITLSVADIDNDGVHDFVYLDQTGALNVLLAPLENDGGSKLDFYAGKNPTQFLLADVSGDSMIDVVVLTSGGNELNIFYNANDVQELRDSLALSTGKEPRGVWIGDVNGDKRNDVVLVNKGSDALSVYLNMAVGLRGQASIALPHGPNQLLYHSQSDSMSNFIVTYPSTQSISYLSLRKDNFSTVNALIPEVGDLELLYATTKEDGSAEFFCYNIASDTRLPSLVYYQQLGAQTFIERTFRLSIPDLLLGAGAGDVNRDGIVDIAYAYRNNETNRNELVLSLGDSSQSYRNRHQILPLPEGTPRRSYMWLQDFGRNDTLDLLLVFPQTLKQMLLAKGSTARKFEIEKRFPEEIVLSDRSQLQIIDLNTDGVVDLVMHNGSKNQIGWYRGMAGGGFSEWIPLLTAPDASHFAFGDLNNDNVVDLAVTFSANGLVKIYDGRVLFKVQEVQN